MIFLKHEPLAQRIDRTLSRHAVQSFAPESIAIHSPENRYSFTIFIPTQRRITENRAQIV